MMTNKNNNNKVSPLILSSVKYRMRTVKYLFENKRDLIPFYSNNPELSKFEGMVITSGMHAIAYKLSILENLSRAFRVMDDPRALKAWKISVIYKNVVIPSYPIDIDIACQLCLGYTQDEYNSPAKLINIDGFEYVQYSLINYNMVANHIFRYYELNINQIKFINHIIDNLYLYTITHINPDYNKFNFVITPDEHGNPHVKEVDLTSTPYSGYPYLLSDIRYHTNTNRKIIVRRYHHMSDSLAKQIRSYYLIKRKENPCFTFNINDCNLIRKSYSIIQQEVDLSHPLINYNPMFQFMNKGISDETAVLLWNDMMPARSSAHEIAQIRYNAIAFLKYMDQIKPHGEGFTESEAIQYVTASSSSAFLGIQYASESQFALNSMLNTLNAHASNHLTNRDWLIPNLEFIHDYLVTNNDVMNKHPGELVLNAKASSASIPGVSSYRDFISQHSWDDITNYSVRYVDNKVPYLMFAGVRNDRRGKYRLIFSMNAYFRAIDYMINNGSYDLCSHGGILSHYTTEGMNMSSMWNEMIKMSDRDGYSMICTDFKGYDTQIDIYDYIRISHLLNKHRLVDPHFQRVFNWYINWLIQPKPIATRLVESYDKVQYRWILEYQHRLASGLHGTHSFENLYGIATAKQMEKLGITVKHSWFNGDDQNFLVKNSDCDTAVDWLNKTFNISWEKSLANHSLSVWSKLWFTRQYHPIWEIGTFRSLFEKEGGEVNMVEESKFASNYCKILQVAILLIRLGKSTEFVRKWINKLCNLSQPQIDSTRIPIFLESLNIETKNITTSLPEPKGLNDSRSYLMNKTFNINLLNTHNYYEMLLSMYRSTTFYNLEPQNILYYPKYTQLIISRGIDYSYNESENIPWIYRNLSRKTSFTDEQKFVRDVLQGTKSYDGISSQDYHFSDMLSLAYAIDNRNREVWRTLSRVYGN